MRIVRIIYFDFFLISPFFFFILSAYDHGAYIVKRIKICVRASDFAIAAARQRQQVALIFKFLFRMWHNNSCWCFFFGWNLLNAFAYTNLNATLKIKTNKMVAIWCEEAFASIYGKQFIIPNQCQLWWELFTNLFWNLRYTHMFFF